MKTSLTLTLTYAMLWTSWLQSSCRSEPPAPQTEDHSVLQWHPGAGEPIRPRILVERFKDNDLARPGPHHGRYYPFAAVPEYFCGTDETLRTKFMQTFEKYYIETHNALHPAYDEPNRINCTIYTYHAPYEFAQPEFLHWLQEHTDRTDLFEPAARKYNNYRGSLAPPFAPESSQVNDSFLRTTFGFAVYTQNNSLVLLNDNRFNPMRWMAPMNPIHHREQASLALCIPPQQGQWERCSRILADRLAGGNTPRILLEYEVEFSFDDFRQQLREFTIWDYYKSDKPFQEPEGITSQVHHNTWQACMGRKIGNVQMDAGTRTAHVSWMEKRLILPNFQASLMINWRSRDGIYRLSELMIAGKNQQPHLWNLTAARELNPFAVDGGGNYNTAWHRASIDMLTDKRFTAKDPSLPPIFQGDPFIEIPDGGLPHARVKGIIDLTAYYVLSRKQGWFPGQKNMLGIPNEQSGKDPPDKTWDDLVYGVDWEWVGFEGDNPQKANPDEKHGIEWIGFIFENHGPFRVKFTLHKLNVITRSP